MVSRNNSQNHSSEVHVNLTLQTPPDSSNFVILLFTAMEIKVGFNSFVIIYLFSLVALALVSCTIVLN